jgi:tRNA 2-(methylsulfanyl)-N6-isopentenyladenosine37 hydroxylase
MFCLKVTTDAGWAEHAIRDLDSLLIDHAHCEMKAASNALSLAMRHCENALLVRTLTDLARDEIDHFQRVLGLLSARGTALAAPSVDTYAASLREASRTLTRDAVATPLVDRLLVGALIEARSCERFKLLSEAIAISGGAEAAGALWRELFASEAGHYRTFVDLATATSGGDRAAVVARLERLAELEGAIVDALNRRSDPTAPPTIHG